MATQQKIPNSVKNLPSVSSLLSESWTTFKDSALTLVIIHVIGYAAIFGIMVLVLLIAIFAGLGGAIAGVFKAGANAEVLLSPLVIFGASALFFIFACYIVISSFINIGSIIVIDDPKKKYSIKELFKTSLWFIIPLAVTHLIAGLLSLGGFMLFIIPGLIISYLLSFSGYEVILGGSRGTHALRRSILIISSHFWGILFRILIIIAITMLLNFLPLVLGGGRDEGFGGTQSIFFFLNIIFGWFSLAYSVTLYKEARTVIDPQKKNGLLIITIVSAVGFAILALIIAGIINLVTSGDLQKMINASQKNEKQSSLPLKNDEIKNIAPSSVSPISY